MNKIKLPAINLMFSFIFMLLCFASESPSESIYVKNSISIETIVLGVDLFILYLIWFIVSIVDWRNNGYIIDNTYRITNYVFAGLTLLLILIKLRLLMIGFFRQNNNAFYYLLNVNNLFILLCNFVITILLIFQSRKEINVKQNKKSNFLLISIVCILLGSTYMFTILDLNCLAMLFNHEVELSFSNIFFAIIIFILFIGVFLFNIIIKRKIFYHTNKKAIKIINIVLISIGLFFIIFNIIVCFSIIAIAKYIGYLRLGYLCILILLCILGFSILNLVKVIQEKF